MFQHLNHRGARRRKEEKEMENLFEKIMKYNFPNLVKEIDFQKVCFLCQVGEVLLLYIFK